MCEGTWFYKDCERNVVVSGNDLSRLALKVMVLMDSVDPPLPSAGLWKNVRVLAARENL